eukprot:20129-Heterococcus_DN1.PRE.1
MHKVEGRAVECSVDYKNALAPVTAAIVKLYICTLCKAAAADTGFKDAIHVQRHHSTAVQRHHNMKPDTVASLHQHNASGTATVIAALRHDARVLDQAFATTVVVQMLVHGAALLNPRYEEAQQAHSYTEQTSEAALAARQ